MFGMSDPNREAMSRVDTAWLRMERSTNLMMISGVLVFDSPLDVARFKRTLAERFLAFRRFRQRAVDLGGQAFWEFDKDFDLNWHVRRVALPGKATKEELEEYVSQLASSPLDKSKPLWQFHIVENYRGGSALVSRIHHCYADGIALVQVLLSLTDTTDKPEVFGKPEKARLKTEGGTVLQRLLEPARHGLDQIKSLGEQAFEGFIGYAKDPQRAYGLVKSGAEEVGDIVSELATALTLPDDPITLFRGPLGVSKRVAWCEPISLELVKTIGKALDCTVNDLLMACAAGALREYLIEEGECPLTGIRATVPVNLRPLEHTKKLGNHFGLVFLDLPVHEANPVARVKIVRDCMQKLKGSRQAIVSFGLLAALGLGPSVVQKPALEMFSRKASAVATNVPGPQVALYLAGSKICEQMFWVPQTGSIGMGISILSYNGQVYFGLITDAKNVPVPDRIVQRFKPELEKLLLLTLMGDWRGGPLSAEAALALLEKPVRAEPELVKTSRAAAKAKRSPESLRTASSTNKPSKLPRKTAAKAAGKR